MPGFGLCARCIYSTSAPAELCYACARRSIEGLAKDCCDVCDLPYEAGKSTCGNPLCNRSDRWFGWNYAIAMRTGQLEKAISRYKYEKKWGWSLVFGRVAGFLEEHIAIFRPFELIVASPTYVGPDGRQFDHTRWVLERAAAELWSTDPWPFDLSDEPVVIKTAASPAMVRHGFRERRDIAEGPLRDALRVTRPQQTFGRKVLVYDDVFTDGLTLNEVARALRQQGGAADVCGISLCRQPFRGAAIVVHGLPD